MTDPDDAFFPGQLLHLACVHQNLELLRDSLEGDERENINGFDKAGRTPVYSAVSNNSSECLSYLLKLGADPNIPSEKFNGMTPLHQAAADNRAELVNILIKHGANVKLSNHLGEKPCDLTTNGIIRKALNMAARRQTVQACEGTSGVVMRQKTKDVIQRNSNRRHAFSDGSLSIHKLKAELSEVSQCDLSKCEDICGSNDLQPADVERIVNTRLEKDGTTILYTACRLNRFDVAEWVIKHGARADIYDKNSNQTALYIACRKNHISCVELILKHFPELITVVTPEGLGCLNILHAASDEGGLPLLRLIMEHPYPDDGKIVKYWSTPNKRYCYKFAFDLNAVTYAKYTALLLTVERNALDMVEYLLQFKVTGYPLQSSYSEIPESDQPQAKLEEYIDTDIKPKQIHPIDTSLTREDGTSPLHRAIMNENVQLVKLLIEYGADVNQPNDTSAEITGSPLLLAVKKENKEIISLILQSRKANDINETLEYCSLQANDELIAFILKHFAQVKDQTIKLSLPMPTVNNRATAGQDETDAMQSVYPVSINWKSRNLLHEIRDQWLSDAALYVNPRIDRQLALCTITSVDVSACELGKLPLTLFRLPSLMHLKATDNQLIQLPDSKRNEWNVPNLKEVDFSKNRFAEVPVVLFELDKLMKLSMANNQIKSVPYEMWTAPNLEELDLSYNKLLKLPSQRKPDRCNMPPTALPSAIEYQGQLSTDPMAALKSGFTVVHSSGHITTPSRCASTANDKATVVRAWHDKISVVDALESPVNPEDTLKTLILANNELKYVPHGLPCLAPNLRRLDLSYNKLKTTGTVHMYPVSLQYLNLRKNRIQTMFCSEEADYMTHKSASYNCLNPTADKRHKRSSSGGDLARKRSSGSFGSMSLLCGHQTCRLENLEILDLSRNLLKEANFTVDLNDLALEAQNEPGGGNRSPSASSPERLLLFPKLTQLDLSENYIRELHASISLHSRLNQLNLSRTKLTDLPPEMGLLKLFRLDLDGCPIEGELANVIQRSNRAEAKLGYLKSVLQDSKPYRTMKLMIVGQTNIGKTTLLAELRKECKSNRLFKTFPQRNFEQAAAETKAGDTLSTVGVDIGELVFDKSEIVKGRGEVTFKTWDFAGQEEYYATHQYFLSKRSLYLVVWKLTDGEKAMENIQQWLVNIQTRSPGAPVIIVGTHYDVLCKKKGFETEVQQLRDLIHKRFLQHTDGAGLPNIVGCLEISAKPRSLHNIKELVKKIYDAAWTMKAPVAEHDQIAGGSHTLLLEQKIPSTYIELEKVVSQIAASRRELKKDPVLKTAEYRSLVKEKLTFRDNAELEQATVFLHDNGVLLHYTDAALSDLYFLDPQWLCDMLAHVVSIKEVNQYVKNGLMPTDKLQALFSRSVIFQSDDMQSYVISLMSKFELALVWDKSRLLIPCLLPSEYDKDQQKFISLPVCKSSSLARRNTEMFVKKRRKAIKVKPKSPTQTRNPSIVQHGASTFYDCTDGPMPAEAELTQSCGLSNAYISSRSHESIRRLYLLSYIPSGFWARLICRIYCDQTISVLTEYIFDLPSDEQKTSMSRKCRTWQCWKTGLSLQYLSADLLKVRQVFSDSSDSAPYFDADMLRTPSDSMTEEEVFQVSSTHILEIEIPESTIEIAYDEGEPKSYKTRKDVQAKLLSKVVDHIETLLQDWYPDLGNKGAQNTKGMYLVSRVIPCPKCLEDAHQTSKQTISREMSTASVDSFDGRSISSGASTRSPRHTNAHASPPAVISCFLVEDLLRMLYSQIGNSCAKHGCLNMTRFAPDLVFADSDLIMQSNEIKRRGLLGKGAFGIVFKGHLSRENYTDRLVAVKTMQPVEPGEDASESLKRHYNQEKRKWEVQPELQVLESYSNARQEINIYSQISHTHIVPLLGVLLNPLSLVLEFAPQGCLEDLLKQYDEEGLKLPWYAYQKIILQTANALAYLHRSRIIHRDIKAENVLVWNLPAPGTIISHEDIDVKLSDYGVSREVSENCGVKGHSGTPAFMAPEIIEFKGSEEYTDKVDIYSFAMLIYELITLKKPFYNLEAIVDIYTLVLDGKRPAISEKETSFPCYMLELMSICWNAEPSLRPSAQQIADIASIDEFYRLHEAVRSEAKVYVTASCIISKTTQLDMSTSMTDVSLESRAGYDLFVAGCQSDDQTVGQMERFTYNSQGSFVSAQSVSLPEDTPCIVSCCAVNIDCWLADLYGNIHVYSSEGYSTSIAAASPVQYGVIKDMIYIERIHRVYVLLEKGVLMEFNSINPEKENSRKISDSATYCMVHVRNSLWIGEKEGYISVIQLYDLESSCLSIEDWMSSDRSHKFGLNHFEATEQYVDTALLVADEDQDYVWSYVYPGTSVYHWNTHTKSLENSFDLMEHVSSTTDCNANLSPNLCQVSSLLYHNSQILVGTTSGRVVILDSKTLSPKACLQPHLPNAYGVAALHPLLETDKYLTIGKGYINHFNHTLDEDDETDDESLHLISWY